jgi:hypothetical protein
MTTIRQLIQTSLARANELFSKLVDTSDSAVKTREKLFAELKEELELLASLEEQHLFPVLRKHKELKNLVREALEDNKLTRKLLTELDRTPKDDEEFGTRVTDLRKVFQQHVRDEKKELLPAVLKALTDEEAGTLVEQFEAGKAEIEEAKRVEAEERRVASRREREKAEADAAKADEARRAGAAERRAAARAEREAAERVQEVAETVVNTAWAAPRLVATTASTSREVVQTSVTSAGALASRTTAQMSDVLRALQDRNKELAEQTSQSMRSLSQTGSAAARQMRDVSSEYIALAQERYERNLEGMNALVRCRTLPELWAAQGALFRENLELTFRAGRRLSEVSARLSEATSAVQRDRTAA